jgi:hypothetical protein
MLGAKLEPREDDVPLPEKPRKSSARRIVILVVAVAAAVWLLRALLPLLIILAPTGAREKMHEFQDETALSNIALAIAVARSESDVPLTPDGRIDVYALLILRARDRELPHGEIVELCHGARADEGPTWEEIAAGDYTNFPYQRYRGQLPPRRSESPYDRSRNRVPYLWDRRPADRKRLVVYSDQTVLFEDEATMQEFFRRNPGQE